MLEELFCEAAEVTELEAAAEGGGTSNAMSSKPAVVPMDAFLPFPLELPHLALANMAAADVRSRLEARELAS